MLGTSNAPLTISCPGGGEDNKEVGGIVGIGYDGLICNCLVRYVTISGSSEVGGVAGRILTSASPLVASNCVANAALSITGGSPAENPGKKGSSGNGWVGTVVGHDYNDKANLVDNTTTPPADPVAKIGETGYATLNAALAAVQNNETILILSDTAKPENDQAIANLNGKTITIKGLSGKPVVMIGDGVAGGSDGGLPDYRFTGANVTFENVTIQMTDGDKEIQGFAYPASLMFKNCTVKGKLYECGSANTVSCKFDGCVFEHGDAYDYCLLTYGCKSVTVLNSTFNTMGKGLKVYWGSPVTLTASNCVFNSTGGKSKPAIMVVNRDWPTDYKLNIMDCTQSGFAVGVIGDALWGTDDASDIVVSADRPLVVKVDGVQVYPQTARTVEVTPETVQAALDGAKKGDTIVLTAGDYGVLYLRNNGGDANRIFRDVTIKVKAGAAVTVDQIAYQCVSGKSLDIENLTIDGITFDAPAKSAVLFDENGGNLRVNGLTVKNCTKVGDNSQGSTYDNAAFVGCYYDGETAVGATFNGDTSLTRGYHNISVLSNAITNVFQPIKFPNSGPLYGLTVSGNTFTGCTDNHFMLSTKTTGNVIITDNAIADMTGRFARISGAQATAAFTITGNTVTTPKKYDTGNDGSIVKITGTAGFTVTDQDNDWNAGTVTSGTYIAMGDTSLLPVCKIGDTTYATLAAALKAAASGQTIEILGGTWGAEAVGSLTTAEAGVVRYKSLTIQPAQGATVKFTADVYLGYDDSSTANATMTVKGLAFEGASLTLSNYVQADVEDCTFTGAGNAAGALVIMDSCCTTHKTADAYPADSVVVKNCTVTGTGAGKPGIRIRNSGNVTMTGNAITGSLHNGILFESNGSHDKTGVKSVTVTGNTITDWNAGNAAEGGRAIRAALGFGSGSTVTMTDNTFSKATLGLDEPDFVKITGTQSATVDINGNSWNNMFLSEVSGNGAIYTVDGSSPAITSVKTTKVAVAKIGTKEYESVLAAYAAAHVGDTINLLVSEIGNISGIPQGVTIEGVEGMTTVTEQLSQSEPTLNGVTLRKLKFTSATNAIRWCYLSGESTFTLEDCEFDQTGWYSLHFDGETQNGKIVARNTIFRSTVAVAGGIACEFDLCQFLSNTHATDVGLSIYTDSVFRGCTFAPEFVSFSGEPNGSFYVKGDITISLFGCSMLGTGKLTDMVNRAKLDKNQGIVAIDAGMDGAGNYNSGTFVTAATSLIPLAANCALFKQGDDYVWQIGVMIDPGKGEKTVPAIEQTSDVVVNSNAVDTVVTDEEVAQRMKSETTVTGVKLTTEAPEGKKSGMQAVVDKAKAESEAVKSALDTNASMVTVKVDVVVSPTTYVSPAASQDKGVVAFDLTPLATVTVVTTNSSGEVASSVSQVVDVTNGMIDQDQKITVVLHTGFLPSLILHNDNNGKMIESFTGEQIAYAGGTCVIQISHFSQILTIQDASYVAMVDGKMYETLQGAFDAVTNGTVTLLKDVELTTAVTLDEGKTATFDLAGKTVKWAGNATATADGLIVNSGNLTLTGGGTLNAGSGVFASCTGNGETTPLYITDGFCKGTFPMPVPAVTNAGPIFVSGGKFTERVPPAFCAVGYEPKEEQTYDGYWTVKDAEVYIRNVKAVQRYPWNGFVDITFEMRMRGHEEPVTLFVAAYYQGKRVTSLTTVDWINGEKATVNVADGTFKVAAPEKKTIHLAWNSNNEGSEFKDVKAEDITVKVFAKK